MINLDPKTKKLLWLGLKILGVTVVLGTVLWFAVINPYLTRKEKQRFEAAAAELEKLSQEIQSKIGPATKIEFDKRCDRPNLKFNKGPLSCDVFQRLTYLNNNTSEANQQLLRLQSISEQPLRVGSVFLTTPEFIDTDKSRQTIFQNLKERSELECTATYELVKDSLASNFEVYISCGGPARAEHYPVKE